MKKMVPILGFSIACMISVAACQHTHKATTARNIQAEEVQQSQNQKDVSAWKTYTNKQLRITFKYPSSWSQRKELNAVNRDGFPAATEVHFEDTLLHSQFMLIYHPAPSGESLYQYAIQQYSEGKGWYAEHKREMQIAGRKALVATSKVTKNGKGNALSTPFKSIVVVFLDQQNKGEFELQFTLPHDGSIDDKDVQHVLSSIQFIQ